MPHLITRHVHPKARPETPEPTPAPATGIAYLHLVADAHNQQVREDELIGFHSIYPQSCDDEQLPGQLSLDDLTADPDNEQAADEQAFHEQAFHDQAAFDEQAFDEQGREASR